MSDQSEPLIELRDVLLARAPRPTVPVTGLRGLRDRFQEAIPEWWFDVFLSSPLGGAELLPPETGLDTNVRPLVGDSLVWLDAADVIDELGCYENSDLFRHVRTIPLMRARFRVGSAWVSIPDPLCLRFDAREADALVVSVAHECGPSAEGDIHVAESFVDFLGRCLRV